MPPGPAAVGAARFVAVAVPGCLETHGCLTGLAEVDPA